MLLLIFLLAAFACAAPTVQRELSDANVRTLRLVNHLENLEYALFIGACNSYSDSDFTNAGFRDTFRSDICAAAQQSTFQSTAISELLVSIPSRRRPRYFD